METRRADKETARHITAAEEGDDDAEDFDGGGDEGLLVLLSVFGREAIEEVGV